MNVKPLYESVGDIQRFLYLNQLNTKYENLMINNWFEEVTSKVDSWSEVGFAFHDDEDVLCGWIKLTINRPLEIIDINSLTIIDNKFIVPIIKMITKYLKNRATPEVPKIAFATMVGSHAEKVWDKIILKHNGVIVGIRKNHVYDNRGYIRDLKLYEIPNPDFKTYK